jgi:hypothetical protein
MRLVEFPDDAAYADFWGSNTPTLDTRYIYMGATYNYGDGTDRWCHSMQTVPKSIITNNYDAYENCATDNVDNARMVFIGGKTSALVPDGWPQVTDYCCFVS